MMAPRCILGAGRPRQQGSALIVSMIMLLIVTLIGLAAMRGSSQQTRMAANMSDRALAFQAAEAALREAEAWVSRLDATAMPDPSSDGSSGIWNVTALMATQNVLGWDADRWASSGRAYSGTIEGVAAQPRFVIAYDLAGADDAYFKPRDKSYNSQVLREGTQNFMILARGVGGTTDSEVLLQAHVRKTIDK